MKKQTLVINVTDSKKEFYFLPEQDRKNGKALKRVPLSIVDRQTEEGQLTDFFASYVNREAPRFVLRALKTVYANQWNNKIELLMKECFELWQSRTGYTKQECKELFADMLSDNIEGYLPISADKETEKQYAREHITSIVREHTFTMVKDTDGRRHKKEIIPYTTLEKTQYGKVLDRESIEVPNMDVNDLVQVASLAMIELVTYGLVNAPADMFEYRSYIYKKVNNYIMNERSKVTNEKPYVRTIDKDGEEHVMTEKVFIDRRLSKIDKESVITELEEVLLQSLDKRTNKDNVLFTFRYVLLSGRTNTECAEVLKVDEKQIRRYVSLIQKALNSKYTYDVLNACIND